MNFDLTEDQRSLQHEARRLSHAELAPKAARWDAEAEVPWENIRLLADHGYMGLIIPEEYGGAGANLLDFVIVLEELAWGCVNTSLFVFSARSEEHTSNSSH